MTWSSENDTSIAAMRGWNFKQANCLPNIGAGVKPGSIFFCCVFNQFPGGGGGKLPRPNTISLNRTNCHHNVGLPPVIYIAILPIIGTNIATAPD